MRLDDINNLDFKYLKLTDFENVLNVNLKNDMYLFDLNSTMYISNKSDTVKEYILKHDAHWPLISYLLYETTRLWWLLCKLNDVNLTNIFDIRLAGTKIKYIPLENL
jgi:hypothetical protein